MRAIFHVFYLFLIDIEIAAAIFYHKNNLTRKINIQNVAKPYSIAMMASSGKYGNSGNVFELTADISAVKNGSSDFMTEGVVTVLECISVTSCEVKTVHHKNLKI